MNYNLFNPKGKLDQSTFIIYYILLMSIYMIIGFLIYPNLLRHNVNLIIPNTIFIIINLLILFNYKKRFMECFNNPIYPKLYYKNSRNSFLFGNNFCILYTTYNCSLNSTKKIKSLTNRIKKAKVIKLNKFAICYKKGFGIWN